MSITFKTDYFYDDGYSKMQMRRVDERMKSQHSNPPVKYLETLDEIFTKFIKNYSEVKKIWKQNDGKYICWSKTRYKLILDYISNSYHGVWACNDQKKCFSEFNGLIKKAVKLTNSIKYGWKYYNNMNLNHDINRPGFNFDFDIDF